MPALDVVIAGGGRVGFQTAELLADRDDDITIVETDGDRVDEIADAWLATVIHGDATDPAVLDQAGVADADVVAALTGKAGLNLAVCMAAERLASGVRTVARIDRSEADDYSRLVDEAVFPEHAGARVAANRIAGSEIKALADVTGDVEVMEIEVADGAPAAGKELRSVRFPTGTLVISDDDGSRIARPETTLSVGRRYLVAVDPDVVDEVLKLLRG
ncbi:potassium transporter Trk [Halobacteriales archaeon QS_6_71_20]|nr:MAG: potassium transporter Trk [Halobacteriales archaeon QS_6_71_20]